MSRTVSAAAPETALGAAASPTSVATTIPSFHERADFDQTDTKSPTCQRPREAATSSAKGKATAPPSPQPRGAMAATTADAAMRPGLKGWAKAGNDVVEWEPPCTNDRQMYVPSTTSGAFIVRPRLALVILWCVSHKDMTPNLATNAPPTRLIQNVWVTHYKIAKTPNRNIHF